jgi:hypothetical protein
MKYLHFENNQKIDLKNHPSPKIWKVWNVFTEIVSNFKRVYVPKREICIDESLMAYEGRLSWKQFIPTKRTRFGLITLCEAKTGYVWNTLIYTGKDTRWDEKYRDYGVATSAVLTLLEPLLTKGYCLITDNFYTSLELYNILLEKSTDAYGVVRVNGANSD